MSSNLDYDKNSDNETSYLLGNQANYNWLMESKRQLEEDSRSMMNMQTVKYKKSGVVDGGEQFNRGMEKSDRTIKEGVRCRY